MSSVSTRKPRARRSWGAAIVSFIGEILLTLGVLVLLFVVWELWWTNFDAQKAQNEATGELFSNFSAPLDPADGNGSGTGAGNGSGQDSSAIETQLNLGVGDVFGVLYAPRLGQNYAVPISEGTSMDILNTVGLGRYSSTQLPGEIGNFAMAGHRQTHGAVLWDMDKFQNGDRIYVQTLEGYYTYEVVKVHIVQPHQSEVVLPNPFDPYAAPTTSMLTLTTCHPPYTTLERMITHAELVDQRPASSGPPAEIADLVKRTVASAQQN